MRMSLSPKVASVRKMMKIDGPATIRLRRISKHEVINLQ